MSRIRSRSKDIKICILFFFAIYIICCMAVTKAYTATVTAKSCFLNDVQNAVNSTARGDTVIVPRGDCTWSGTLSIKKAITLQGAGKTNTIIRSNLTVPSGTLSRNAAYYMITYTPDSISSDSRLILRITGFTFDMNYRSSGIRIYNTNNTPLYKLIIDNNAFVDCWDGGSSTWTAVSAICVYGAIYGVIHSNTFSGWPHIEVMGRERYAYDNFTYEHGTADTIYFEDNVLTSEGQTKHTDGSWWLDNDAGAHVVWRYNTFITKRTFDDHYMTYIPHHGSLNNYASKGGEFYGNHIYHSAGTATGVQLFGIRAGKNLVFYNKVYAAGGRANYIYYPTATAPTNYTCDSGTLRNGYKNCASDGQPQHVWRTFVWNNRIGTSGAGRIISGIGDASLRANIDYFNPNTNCTASSCTSGVGCGSSTPTGTCTAGVGFWKTSQSCSEVPTESVGANPVTPLSGMLYRCTSTNNWTPYYTPYNYPHPLRVDNGDVDDKAISAPKGFKVVN